MLTVLLFGLVTFAQLGPAPQPAPVNVHVDLVAPPPDDTQIADASVTSSQAVLNTVIAPAPIGWANDLLGIENIWTTTPDNLTWNNPAIRSLALGISGIAAALVGLAILLKAGGIALGQEDWESLFRVLYALALSVLNLIFWEIGIRANNLMTAAIAGPSLPSMIKPHLVTTVDPAALPGTVILLIVYAIVSIMLLLSLLFRLGLIDILIVAGSVLLFMDAMSETSHMAAHYRRLSIAVIFGQVLVVICLKCASVLGSLGNGGALGTLLSIAILWLAMKAPQAILAGSGAAGGGNIGGMLFAAIRRRLGR